MRTTLLALALGVSFAVPADSAEILVHPPGSVYLLGEIVPGDFDRLRSVIERASPVVGRLVLRSNGGNLIEAIKIGHMVRELRIGTVAPFGITDTGPACYDDPPEVAGGCVCASACFFIFVAGADRFGNRLLVHRPSFPSDFFAGLSAAEAMDLYSKATDMTREYLRLMGAPEQMVDEVMSVPSSEVLEINASQIAGAIPGYEEWLTANCGPFDTASILRMSFLDDAHMRGTAHNETEHQALQDRWWEDLDCRIQWSHAARVEAYTAYFGKPPPVTPSVPQPAPALPPGFILDQPRP